WGEGGTSDNRADQPDKIANEFRVTPWVSKFKDSDPYHDWYLLELRVFHDANVEVPFTYSASRRIGWYADYREIKVLGGDPNNVFLIDWAPKQEAEIRKETSTVGFSANCGASASFSGSGVSGGPSCNFGFSSTKSTMKTVSDANYKRIELHRWSPQQPNGADYVWWAEDILDWQNGTFWGLPKIASETYESNRMMIWETSKPLDGALLEMYMWAVFGHEFSQNVHVAIVSSADRQCLGVKPMPEDHSIGCVTDHDKSFFTASGYDHWDDIRVAPFQAGNFITPVPMDMTGEMFRLVQYRPPTIPMGQMPSSTSPVWVNQSVDVAFNPAIDPDGDRLLYQFDFGDGTFYPAKDCASNPDADGCQDEVCYDVCVGKECASTQQECLRAQCDADGCFGPSRTVQHAWSANKLEDLMGVKNVRARAAEAQCFPPADGGPSPCVEKARGYGINDNYNYKSGWSDSFPVTIQGLSSISIEKPASGYLFDDSSWMMQCTGKWYNQGTPFEEDCSACDGSLTWAITDGAGNPTERAAIDAEGLLTVYPLPTGVRFANIMVKAECTDHGTVKSNGISLGIENDFVVFAGLEMTIPNAILGSGGGEQPTEEGGGEAPPLVMAGPEGGVTINDKLAECEALGGDQALACVLDLTTEWVNSGLITEQQKQEIDQAAKSAFPDAGLAGTAAPLGGYWAYILLAVVVLSALGGWFWWKRRKGAKPAA
ncbi:MAG: DUF2157 domain-containing protein, partial [Anaerolineales bacterium]|nr:DUF2157 domain-containing protein [Anaerolineales bacterium]